MAHVALADNPLAAVAHEGEFLLERAEWLNLSVDMAREPRLVDTLKEARELVWPEIRDAQYRADMAIAEKVVQQPKPSQADRLRVMFIAGAWKDTPPDLSGLLERTLGPRPAATLHHLIANTLDQSTKDEYDRVVAAPKAMDTAAKRMEIQRRWIADDKFFAMESAGRSASPWTQQKEAS